MKRQKGQEEDLARPQWKPALNEVSDILEHPKEKSSNCHNQQEIAQLPPQHSHKRLNQQQNQPQGHNYEEEDCSSQSSILSCLRGTNLSQSSYQSSSSECESEISVFEDQSLANEMNQGFPCEEGMMRNSPPIGCVQGSNFQYSIVWLPQTVPTDASHLSSSQEKFRFDQYHHECLNNYQYLQIQQPQPPPHVQEPPISEELPSESYLASSQEDFNFDQYHHECLNNYQYLQVQQPQPPPHVQESPLPEDLPGESYSASSSRESSFAQLYHDYLNNGDYEYLQIFRPQGNSNGMASIGQLRAGIGDNNQSSSKPQNSSELRFG